MAQKYRAEQKGNREGSFRKFLGLYIEDIVNFKMQLTQKEITTQIYCIIFQAETTSSTWGSSSISISLYLSLT